MIPELGKYAGAVLWSYAASVALILGFILWSLWQGRQVKRALRDVEERQRKDHG